MSKEKQTEEQSDKVVTRYDRRMEKRKKEEEKERRSWKRFKIVSIVILAAVAVSIVFSIGTSFYNRYTVLNQTYFQVGDHDITRLEYNYYFNNVYSNYLSMYGSYVSMMGLDTTVDLDEQTYPGNENMTWKDYFDQSAVEQIQQIKAMADEARENGFEYDSSEDMASYETEIAAQAESASVSESDYYALMYGDYATPSRIETFVEENLFANAYYNHLVEENQPAEDEIQAYYEENKNSYDTVTYRSFYFEVDTSAGEETGSEETTAAETTTAAEETTVEETTLDTAEETAEETTAAEETEAASEETAAETAAEETTAEETTVAEETTAEETTVEETTTGAEETAAEETTAAEEETETETASEEETGMTDEEIAAAMDELKVQADEMAARLEAGEDFEDLCVEYASEDQKENYGGEEDGSLTEEGSYFGAPSVAADWLFDESRQEGDITVLESESLNRYYVVQFISRQNDEETINESIGNLLASQVVSEYVTEIAQEYTVTDVAGDLHYLTVPEESTEAAETETATETDETAETAAAEAAETTETAAAEAAETTETAAAETTAAETETAAETTEAAAETAETESTTEAAEETVTEETESASAESTAADAR